MDRNLPSGLEQQSQLITPASQVPVANVNSAGDAVKLPASPQLSIKPSAAGDFKFPPAFDKPAQTSSTAPASSLVSPIQVSSWSGFTAKTSNSLKSSSYTNDISIPISATVPQPQERRPADRDQLIDHLCRIGLTQADGILDMFVAAKVSDLCRDVFRSFQIQRFERELCKYHSSIAWAPAKRVQQN